jgi:hypothetical protein
VIGDLGGVEVEGWKLGEVKEDENDEDEGEVVGEQGERVGETGMGGNCFVNKRGDRFGFEPFLNSL